ncbi:Chitinase 2 [Dimargaris verticillata]|uniref:chitinase n=1 Tax=Dimargaris verticillata TaxID=2761393 RepID=A0A9W8B1F3_9FUNG|nr:Chitinase 2 [Dimargaris verticillata]
MLRWAGTIVAVGLMALLGRQAADALDLSCNNNLVSYWGQNIYKFKHNATGEQGLDYYCENNPSEDILVVSFLNTYDPMIINLSDHCYEFFNDTKLLNCPKVGEQIKKCQSLGKTVLLSMGGQEGEYRLTSEQQGKRVAQEIWDMFLGGQGDTRPFGDAVLDGLDLDIEKNDAVGYTDFIKTMRDLYASDKNKKYYMAAAPLCHYPDLVMPMTYNEAWFDMIFVQFYNSPCGADNFGTQTFNFEMWDAWARIYSVNKDVKVFLGLPSSEYAALTGYVDADRMKHIVGDLQSTYSSFGGVMLYDISESRPNGDYSKQAKDEMNRNANCGNSD